MSYMNLIYSPAHHESFAAQWLEYPTKVMGSIPVGDSDFFFLPSSWLVDHIISSPRETFTTIPYLPD